MDYEDIIKLQEQSPAYSTGNNQHSKQCMVAFYDNDSENQAREQEPHNYYDHFSFDQAIDYMQNYVDIVDTPLDEILNYFEKLDCAENLDRHILRKKIIKRKNILKRYRAKNRQPKLIYNFEQFPLIPTIICSETESQIKKKRNRVSAQVSRDRKKQYFKQLQDKNSKLQEQILKTKIINEKLKKQIEESAAQPKKLFSQTFNNKLTKLLVFLGIIFLISMLKGTFTSNSDSLSSFKNSEKLTQIEQFSSNQHNKMIEEGQRKVAKFLQEEQVQQDMLVDTEQRKSFYHGELSNPLKNTKRFAFFQTLISKLTTMKDSIDVKHYNY